MGNFNMRSSRVRSLVPNDPFQNQLLQIPRTPFMPPLPPPGFMPQQNQLSNDPNDPKFGESKTLRELLGERMLEQQLCLGHYSTNFLAPLHMLSETHDSSPGKKGPGDKHIAARLVAHIQMQAHRPKWGDWEPLKFEVQEVADEEKRFEDPMGRYHQLESEIEGLMRLALPPTPKEAQGYMADTLVGRSEPLVGKYKTLARILGAGDGSDARGRPIDGVSADMSSIASSTQPSMSTAITSPPMLQAPPPPDPMQQQQQQQMPFNQGFGGQMPGYNSAGPNMGGGGA